MKLIVGLGNPGIDYAHTRHNMGYDCIDLLASDFNVSIDKKGFDGLYAKVVFKGETVYLLKPLTYMNLSGKSVKAIADYYHIMTSDILVVSDDLALPPGSLRLRERGSSGGHNGLKNIIECLGSEDFKRIRIGIGEPSHDTVDYVLGKPKGPDQEAIEEAINQAVKAIEHYLKEDNFNKTASLFNKKVGL